MDGTPDEDGQTEDLPLPRRGCQIQARGFNNLSRCENYILITNNLNELQINSQHNNVYTDVAEQAEAMQMLDNIFNKTGSKKAAHCLAMLYFIKDKISLVIAFDFNCCLYRY